MEPQSTSSHKNVSELLVSIAVIIIILGGAFWYLKMKKNYGFSTRVVENAPKGSLATNVPPEMILAKDAVIEDSAQYVVSEVSKGFNTEVSITTYNTKTSRDALNNLYTNYAKHAGFTDTKSVEANGVISISARKEGEVLFVVVRSLNPTFSEVRITLDKEIQ
ncbi:hypothetical protein KW790_01175 [Candidatus Parcubacteria bacterium]|nr:hypothetical protein [Candidatus Parcubacteria bacterium]